LLAIFDLKDFLFSFNIISYFNQRPSLSYLFLWFIYGRANNNIRVTDIRGPRVNSLSEWVSTTKNRLGFIFRHIFNKYQI